ncbi:MAG: NlpC/P60 family protein [Coriobacteriales bacterium]|nr:NlpC/P60 family protein [Coriobacteriales bacterium]
MPKPLYARLAAGALSLLAALSICSFACPARAEEAESPSSAPTVQATPTNMYRLCSPSSGEHFYTASAGEKKALIEEGWRFEGVGWVAPSISSVPVYRLYNSNGGDHHYTTSAGERDLLVQEGWNDEGIGWYSDEGHTVAILRQYNPQAETGAHNFTSSEGERDLLVQEGWNDEGLAWYGLQKGKGVEKPTILLTFAPGSSSLGASLLRSDYSTGHLEISVMDEYDNWYDWVQEDVTADAYSPINAVRMRLTGDLLGAFDVWYRVNVPGIGWAGWAKNGTAVGSSGMSLGIDNIEVALTTRHGEAPGSVGTAFYEAGQTAGKTGYQNPEGFYQVSANNVTITDKAVAPWDYVTPSRISIQATREECVEAFVERAYEYLGSPYMWNYSCAPEIGVDCIGLIYQCAYACGMDLGGGVEYDDFNPWAHYSTGATGWHSHDSNNFWEYGKAMHVGMDSRRRGDIIVWSGHSAIYIGNDTIIEAYDGLGVVMENVWAHGTPWGCIRLFQ